MDLERSRLVLGLAFGVAACAGNDSTNNPATTPSAPLADSCRVRLPPRAAPLEQPPALAKVVADPARPSRMIAHVEMKLASLAKELETKVPPRLAEEHGKGIGVGGHLNYTVDRGPFSVAVEGDSLLVRTDIRSHAEACRGNSCYASCDPQGRATAAVPLRLTPDYKFAPSRVAFAFTRGCEIRVLGGMVKIDITPTIQSELAPSLRHVEHEIDGKLPPMRPQAERLWTELGKTRSLPLGGCVVVNPRGIVEGPVGGTADALRVRFGLVAYPELRSRCGDPPIARPLPPLAQDPAMPAEDDLVLSLVSPLATALGALEASGPFDAGAANTRSRIARTMSAVHVAGNAAQIDLALGGEACGDLGVRSPIAWGEDGRMLRLAAPAPLNGEAQRASAAGLDPNTLTRSLAGLRFAPSVPPDAVKDLVPGLASQMSDPTVDVSAKVSRVSPFEAKVRGDDLFSMVLVRGSIDLKQK